MNNFLRLILGNTYIKFFSYLVKILLKLKGIKIGKNFICDTFPKIIFIGEGNEIVIGDNVTFFGEVELRCYNKSSILISHDCKIDKLVRIIAAKSSDVKIGSKTEIGAYSILNCGSKLTIGKKTMISSKVLIQLSEHNIKKDIPVKEQGNKYNEMIIGNDVLIGTKSTILMGSKLNNGCIIGANTLIKTEVGSNQIFVGIPGKMIGIRE